jgi:hypothetical protein
MPGLGRTWDELFQALLLYKSEYGDCCVPQYFQADAALGQWVGKQRSRLAGLPTDPKHQRLDAIGFDWESQDQKNERIWNDKYQRLAFYKAKHGHCRVPKGYKDDIELGNWVSMQRILWKKQRLSQERVDKLQALQFTWVLVTVKNNHGPSNKLEEKWLEKYDKLVEYQQANGHCVVPKAYKQDGLGYWVGNQRAACGKGDLSEARKELLDKVGFVWRIPKNAQKRRLNELQPELLMTDESPLKLPRLMFPDL